MSRIRPQLQQPFPESAAPNSNKSIMNFEEQPCSQLFCPHARPVCPTTSPALHPPLMCFQTHQIMIHWKRFLHLLRVFFLLLKLSEHFKGKTSSAVLMLQKGKAPSTRQRWESTGPRPVGGNQPSLPPAIDVSLLLTPTQGKSFYPLLRVCASSNTDPSSDQKYSVSEHTFVCNRTAFLWKFTLLH